MSNFNWCHGPSCHKSHTQDRIRGVKGSKVLRTKKIKYSDWNSQDRYNMFNYFCSQNCLMNYISKHLQSITAIAPRTEALETPIDVVKEQKTDYFDRPYTSTRIITVDNNGG
jgi:hypothetical protein